MASDLYFERMEATDIGNRRDTHIKRLTDGVVYKSATVGCGVKKHFDALEFDKIPANEDLNQKNVFDQVVRRLKKIMAAQQCGIKKVLIAGIGNPYLAVDKFGSVVVDRIQSDKNILTFKPLLSGITGIDSFDVVKGLTLTAKPDAVIAIDTLRTGSPERIGKSLQITDDGMQAGSGVGAKNTKMCEASLGVPVIAIGVPLVAPLYGGDGGYLSDVTIAKSEAIIDAYSDFLSSVFAKIL